MIRIGEPCRRDRGDGYPESDPQFGWRPSRGARAFFSRWRRVVGFVHVLALLGSMSAVRRKAAFRHRFAALVHAAVHMHGLRRLTAARVVRRCFGLPTALAASSVTAVESAGKAMISITARNAARSAG